MAPFVTSVAELLLEEYFQEILCKLLVKISLYSFPRPTISIYFHRFYPYIII
jgi:hypothetical protein